MATRAHLPLLTVADFLEIDFGPQLKAELANGVIRMMAGGSGAHNRVQRNLIGYLHYKLRHSGCSPYGSDQGIETDTMSLRFPDVSIFCGRDTRQNDRTITFDDPKVIFEVLSPSTAHYDLGEKLDEYRTVASLDAVVFADPESERVRVVGRTGVASWSDAWIEGDVTIDLPTLGLQIPLSEVFARD